MEYNERTKSALCKWLQSSKFLIKRYKVYCLNSDTMYYISESTSSLVIISMNVRKQKIQPTVSLLQINIRLIYDEKNLVWNERAVTIWSIRLIARDFIGGTKEFKRWKHCGCKMKFVNYEYRIEVNELKIMHVN